MDTDDDIDRCPAVSDKFVAALDVGTTTIRCLILDQSLQLRGSAHDEVQLLYPHAGHVEIDPEDFWKRICATIKRSLIAAGIDANQIAGLGICTQRSTFITWDKVTGQPYHNFITWKDLRADPLVRKWNSSYMLKVGVNLFSESAAIAKVCTRADLALFI